MSVRQSLGKVAVVPKGSWDGTNTYEFLDIVKYGGGSYIARKDVPIGTAITNTDYWASLVDKGDIGDDGVSPSVTVTPITGGHRVTITDATHPQGQSIDVMDGEVNNIDTTLSVSGAAADAAVTGFRIGETKDILDDTVVIGENLFNPNEAREKAGYWVNSTTGEPFYDGDNTYCISDYIRLDGVSPYTVLVASRVWLYDAGKGYLRTISASPIAIPAGPFYVIVGCKIATVGNTTVAKGEDVTSPIPYEAPYVNPDAVKVDSALSEEGMPADAKAVGEKFEATIHGMWAIGELTNTGAVNRNNTGLRFFECRYMKRGSTISLKSSGYKFNVARYTAKNAVQTNFISGSYASYNFGDTYTVEEDSWVMCSIWRADSSPFSDTEDSNVVEVREVVGFDSVYGILESINSAAKNTPLNKNDFCYFGPVPIAYYSGLLTDYSADGFGRNTDYQTIIEKFDSLVDGYYATKVDKGLSSDNTNHLFEYDFAPPASTLTNKGKTLPTVLITSGLHGFEKASVYGLYYFLKDLKENWAQNPVLDYLRHHVLFKIIPCCNPYGFNNNAYWNASGVNLNRNFATTGWKLTGEPFNSTYSGPTANSEKETKIVSAFIEENPHAIIFVDFHTNGQYAVTEFDKVNWLDFADFPDSFLKEFEYLACAHIETITAHFNEEYNLGLTSQLCGYVTYGMYGTDFPSSDTYALEHGVLGHTMEGFTGFPNRQGFSAEALKGNSEIIGNWIGEVVNKCGNLL